MILSIISHRARRERQNILSAAIRETIILPTLSAPDGARGKAMKALTSHT
jgi:hypothetical protein